MRRPAAFLLVSLLAACGSGEDRAPRAALNVVAIGVFEAKPALWGPSALVTEASQPTLVGIDSSGLVVPGLATSWRVSDDGLSVIFRLREARWPDGRAITAADVVAVYRRLLGGGSRHPLAPLLIDIAGAPEVMAGRASPTTLGISDPLPNIVEIRLSSPQPELLQMLASPVLAIVRRGASSPNGGAFIATAPQGGTVQLRRSASYFDAGAVPLGRISLRAEPSPDAAIAAFRDGKAEVVVGTGLAGLAEASKLGRVFRVDRAWTSYAYVVGQRRGPLTDSRVRRALAMAIDRDRLLAALPNVTGIAPMTGLAPPLPSAPDPARPDWSDWQPEARQAEARRLIEEAGYGPTKPLSVRVLICDDAAHRAVLDLVSNDWATLGVQTVSIRSRGTALAEASARGGYDLALAERQAPVDSLAWFLEPFRCRGAQPCDRAAEGLIRAAHLAATTTERKQTLHRAEQMLADDTPQIALFTVPRWALVARRVAGWTPNPLARHPLQRLDVLPGR